MKFTQSTMVILGTTAMSLLAPGVRADPMPNPQPQVVLPPAFCFRITDIERVPGDVTGNAFTLEFEVLNWTNRPAAGLNIAANIGTTFGPVIGGLPMFSGAGIDPDGRGGPLGGADIGAGTFDSPAIHSGRGRGDIAGLLNDWSLSAVSVTSSTWGGGTVIPNRDLLGATTTAAAALLVPGTTVIGGVPIPSVDTLGDPAADGGPGVFPNPVVPDGSGNVLDGFTMTITDWNVGEVLSLNWFLMDAAGAPLGTPTGPIGPPFGSAGNGFGFGIFNLARIPVGGALPDGLFAGGNTGFGQSPLQFFDTVFSVPNPAEFAVEFGAGVTAPFLNPSDNIFNVQANIPTPSAISLLTIAGLASLRRRRHA